MTPSQSANPMALRGMVTTPHYLASGAGLDVLRRGGNAVEAAIAASAVLAVVYPQMCTLGGDAFWLVWDASQKKLVGINASGRAGLGASRKAYLEGAAGAFPPGAGLPAIPCLASSRAGRRPGSSPWA